MTPEQLGSRIGLSRWGILNYEKGFNPIYYETAILLSDALRINPSDLLDDYTRFCMPGYGKRIKALRSLYGVSQAKFGEIAGFTRYSIGMWEAEVYNHHPRRQVYLRFRELAEVKGADIHDTRGTADLADSAAVE